MIRLAFALSILAMVPTLDSLAEPTPADYQQTLDQAFEAADRVGNRHITAGCAGELLGNVERL